MYIWIKHKWKYIKENIKPLYLRLIGSNESLVPWMRVPTSNFNDVTRRSKARWYIVLSICGHINCKSSWVDKKVQGERNKMMSNHNFLWICLNAHIMLMYEMQIRCYLRDNKLFGWHDGNDICTVSKRVYMAFKLLSRMLY